MHPSAAKVLTALGGDPSDFAARRLTPHHAASADMIIAMTLTHREEILELAPHCLNRTFTLSEASKLCAREDVLTVSQMSAFRSALTPRQRWDIADPIGQSFETFAEVGKQIKDLLPPVLHFCRRHLSAGQG